MVITTGFILRDSICPPVRDREAEMGDFLVVYKVSSDGENYELDQTEVIAESVEEAIERFLSGFEDRTKVQVLTVEKL